MPIRVTTLPALVVWIALAVVSPANAAQLGFEDWTERFKKEARAAGIDPLVLERAFTDLEPDPRIIELDRHQPEGRLTFAGYRERVISQTRIERGRRLLDEHRSLLQQVEQRFGVPSEIIVALWGIESNYGDFEGRFPVVQALATLAFDGRRARFFENELLSALRIIDAGDIALDAMFGSWAGAMGQSQFMPSTYAAYAVDANGDGRRDIWYELEDIFASMANFLSASGWDARYRWGRAVDAPRDVVARLEGLDHRAPLAVWSRLGVTREHDRRLPNAPIEASLIVPDGSRGPAFLVYDNFHVLLRWNRSSYFALSVGLLADALKG